MAFPPVAAQVTGFAASGPPGTKTAEVDGQQVMVAGGTLLVKNVYSVAFNYAAYQGNQDRLVGLDAYETARAARSKGPSWWGTAQPATTGSSG